MREADPTHEVFKARIRAEWIEAWADQDARIEAFFVTFLQPTHGLIHITERCINH